MLQSLITATLPCALLWSAHGPHVALLGLLLSLPIILLATLLFPS